MTTQQALALFWTVSALVGLILTTRNLAVAWHGYRAVKEKRGDQGIEIMAFSHVRSDAIRLWMHLTFVVVGIAAAIPHAPGTFWTWLATGVVMSIPLLLIVLSVTAASDRARAARAPSFDPARTIRRAN